MYRRYPGGRSWSETEFIECPNCGHEVEVTLVIIDEPRSENYPGYHTREIESGGECERCKYTLEIEDLPEEDDRVEDEGPDDED